MTISDSDILFDLEYKGIDAFLSEMSCGFKVPTVFVERVKDIIAVNYNETLEVVTVSEKTFSGSYCLMPYVDETMTTLVMKKFVL